MRMKQELVGNCSSLGCVSRDAISCVYKEFHDGVDVIGAYRTLAVACGVLGTRTHGFGRGNRTGGEVLGAASNWHARRYVGTGGRCRLDGVTNSERSRASRSQQMWRGARAVWDTTLMKHGLCDRASIGAMHTRDVVVGGSRWRNRKQDWPAYR